MKKLVHPFVSISKENIHIFYKISIETVTLLGNRKRSLKRIMNGKQKLKLMMFEKKKNPF